MDLAPAAATLVGALALTYVLCVRPMLRGRCVVSGSPTGPVPTAQTRQEAQITELRSRIAALRAGEATDHRAGADPQTDRS